MKRLVLAGAFSLALLWAGLVVIWFLAPSDLARNIYIPMLVVALVIYVPVVGKLNAATGLAAKSLDERQRAERQRATAIGQRVTTYLLGAATVIALLLSTGAGNLTTVPTALIYPLFFSLWLTHYSMPGLIAGWRMLEPPPDDEED